ncbi:MAG TPA: hypothetical protein VGL53_09950 [Bryobacteraceae bacterium]
MVDLCDLVRHADVWNGKEVRVPGVAKPAVAEQLGPSLEAPGGCGEAPGIVVLVSRELGRLRTGFTWDQESERKLDEALLSYDPLREQVSATIVGVFAAPDRTHAESSQLVVRTAAEVHVEQLTQPINDAQRKEAEWLIGFRGRIFWRLLIAALRDTGGRQYFERNVRGALIPGGVNAVQFIPGEVVSVRASDGDVVVAVSVNSGRPPEAQLRLVGWKDHDSVLLKPGTAVVFRGVALTFTQSPISVEVEVHPDDLVIQRR